MYLAEGSGFDRPGRRTRHLTCHLTFVPQSSHTCYHGASVRSGTGYAAGGMAEAKRFAVAFQA